MGTGKNFPSNKQLHSRKIQICSVLNLERASVFGLRLWLYNKALIDQLVRSVRENIRIEVLKYGSNEVRYVRKAEVRIFSRMDSELVNKSILSTLHIICPYETVLKILIKYSFSSSPLTARILYFSWRDLMSFL